MGIKRGLVALLSSAAVFICTGGGLLHAQTEVIADGRLQTILEKHVEYNRMAKTTKGFRVKAATFTGEGAKDKAFQLKKNLLQAFPEQRTYVVFDEPYFIVKTGDFPTRLDAYATFLQIKNQIPTALIVADYINAPVINEDDFTTPEYFEEELEN
ncbi:MAG: hypothetical protein J6P44_06840 [Bacteroidales bacterium]|nr:hypothetical protein [Bacteroidales bacterium]